jgi:hypothetical protein
VGAAALVEALKTNSTLKKLNLCYNQIGDEGATALGKALKTNSTIKILGIYGNQIGDEGETVIWEGLKRNKDLASYKEKLSKVQEATIKVVTANSINIKEADKSVWQYQLAIKKNPAPDLFQVEDNNDINKYISSKYFWLIGVCKGIDTHPLSILVEAQDCMAHMLSFLKPTSLFPELLTSTNLLPKFLPYTSDDKQMIGSVVEETDS